MAKGICVAVPGTVTIDTEEYRELVTAQAYLNVMTAFACDPAFILKDIACIVKDLTAKPVITGEEPSSEDEDGDTDA